MRAHLTTIAQGVRRRDTRPPLRRRDRLRVPRDLADARYPIYAVDSSTVGVSHGADAQMVEAIMTTARTTTFPVTRTSVRPYYVVVGHGMLTEPWPRLLPITRGRAVIITDESVALLRGTAAWPALAPQALLSFLKAASAA